MTLFTVPASWRIGVGGGWGGELCLILNRYFVSVYWLNMRVWNWYCFRFVLQFSQNSCGSGERLTAVLSIVETNPFKHLIHLSLKFVPGSDSDIKKYLADCLKQLKASGRGQGGREGECDCQISYKCFTSWSLGLSMDLVMMLSSTLSAAPPHLPLPHPHPFSGMMD